MCDLHCSEFPVTFGIFLSMTPSPSPGSRDHRWQCPRELDLPDSGSVRGTSNCKQEPSLTSLLPPFKHLHPRLDPLWPECPLRALVCGRERWGRGGGRAAGQPGGQRERRSTYHRHSFPPHGHAHGAYCVLSAR